MSRWLMLILFPVASYAAQPIPPLYQQVAAEKDIPPYVLYLVARIESNCNLYGRWMPCPWVFNDRGQSLYFKSHQKAKAHLAKRLREKRRPSIAIGLAQIHCYWHCHKVAEPLRLLEPLFNLRYAADVLAWCYEREHDWREAIGCYNDPGGGHYSRSYKREFDRKVRWATK